MTLPLGVFSPLAISLLLAGCATVRNAAPPDSFCAVARLIHPHPADTNETLRQVLAHNEKVRRLCWREEENKAR